MAVQSSGGDVCTVSRGPLTDEEQNALTALGSAVRGMRLAAGMSQEALADAARLDRSHMGRIERGQRNLTAITALRIARVLGIKPSKLFENAGL